MKQLLSIVCFLSLFGFLKGQDFINDQLLPGIEAADYVYDFYQLSNKPEFACPPHILKSPPDTLFGFLNDFLAAENETEQQILETMMADNCRPYYTCRTLNDFYFPVYSQAIKDAGLPLIYAMMPLALSGSNPGFYGKNDKAGAWQLSYIDGRRFGLQINGFIDERNDIGLSSKAAASYLNFLDTLFKGNSILVITAFYTGVPYVKNRLGKLGVFDADSFYNQLNSDVLDFLVYLKTWDSWYRNFNKVESYKIIEQGQKSWEAVQSKDTLGFIWIEKTLHLKPGLIETMNPAYVGGVLLPGFNRVPFYLPKTKAREFNTQYANIVDSQNDFKKEEKRELEAVKDRLKKGIPDPKNSQAIIYTVRSGDVLGKIAQNYDVKVSSIKNWNNLHSDRINIGQELVVYIPKDKKLKSFEKPLEEEPSEINIGNPEEGKGRPKIYTVKQGESLWLIARKFPGVSAENIMKWNGINDKIKAGQKLKIYKAK